MMQRMEEKINQRPGMSFSNNAKRKNVLQMIAEMMVEKKERFGIPLPEEIELPAVDVDDCDGEAEKKK